MANSNSKSNAFWADLSKKGGTWAGVAGLGAILCSLISGGELSEVINNFEVHGATAGLVAGLRVIVGLVQGKTGNPDTAKFDKAS